MSGNSFNDLIKILENDNHIYRGESKAFEHVSSGLFREYSHPWDVEAYQRFELEDAKRYICETDDRAILTEIQHHGGKTNLIDFTTDYYIALFFACESRYDEDGRIIVLDKSKEMKQHIYEPSEKTSRVKTQASIFVRPPKGYIEVGQYETITISKHLKRQLLNYLKLEHRTSTRSVYNDIHGFIEYRKVHRESLFQSS